MLASPGIVDGTLGDIVTFAASPQACGYFASLLVFATFWMQRMARLRLVAICSNLAFFAYAVRLGLAPIAILHAGLLPVNVWRLWQLRVGARPPRPTRPERPRLLNSRLLVEGAAVAGLSLLFVGAAASEVADGGVHCRVERWRDWNQACRALAERAVAMTNAPVAAPAKPALPAGGPSARELQKMVGAARTNPHGRRDALMIQLCYRLRLRPGALLHLRWSNIGPGRLLQVRHRPGRGATRYMLTPQELRQVRLLRRATGRRAPYVFVGPDGRLLSKPRFASIVARAVREAEIGNEVAPQAQQSALRD